MKLFASNFCFLARVEHDNDSNVAAIYTAAAAPAKYGIMRIYVTAV